MSTSNKVQAVKVLDLNTESIAIDDLLYDDQYQRAIVQSHPARKNDFDGDLFGIPLVGRRKSGRLYCVNGQQRISGARLAGYTHIEAVVFDSKGAAHEADVFYHANRDHTLISGVPMHLARHTARHAPALWIERVLGEYDLTALPKGDARDRVMATGILYDLHAGDVLGKTTSLDEAERCMRFALDVMVPIWRGKHAARSWARANIMAGFIINAHALPKADPELVRSLLDVQKVEPKAMAKALTDVGHGQGRKTYAANLYAFINSLTEGEAWA